MLWTVFHGGLIPVLCCSQRCSRTRVYVCVGFRLVYSTCVCLFMGTHIHTLCCFSILLFVPHKHTQLQGKSGWSGAALPIEYLVQLVCVRVCVGACKCVPVYVCVCLLYVCFRARGANKHRSFRNPREISEARGH